MSGIYTIPLSQPFVDVLARGLLRRTEGEALALPRMTILLPTARACRALREAFLRASDRPLLLPRLVPVGEADADELALQGAAGIPPAITKLRRQALLAQALLKSEYTALPAEALALARALARVIDETQTEEVDLVQLETLVPGMFAAHWQKTLSFLSILSKVWPDLLKIENAVDPATRRRLVLSAQAEAWAEAPPASPVIVAGVTGSIKAVRALMQAVAALPTGEIILPGLDLALDETAWQALDAVHPQFAMKTFIDEANLSRQDVSLWPEAETEGAVRSRLIGEIFRPAATAETWHAIKLENQAQALAGLSLCECRSKHEEADAIAALFRWALETPGKRAALVTPDRELARLVAASLGRWDIPVNDSAGMPLAATPPGAFLRLVAAMVAGNFAPVDLLACFKHPLALGGLAAGQFRTLTRRLEIAILRGSPPAPGLEGLLMALEAPEIDAEARTELGGWLNGLSVLAVPVVTAEELPATDMLRVYVAFAEALATGPEGCALWQTETGEALADFVARALSGLAGFPVLRREEFPVFLAALMAEEVVRPRAGLHARLSIWGPIEARLQQADLIVLGGLNEGSWPEAAAPDPFLSRKMREALGLPQPEYRVGLAAHDFAAGLAAPEVVLTRAKRVEGAPAIPSRWLMRLEAVLKALKLELPAPAGGDPAEAMRQLDLAEGPPRPASQPRPVPPVAARPRQLSITDVETWLANPYRLYARRILRLKPLDPLAMEPGAADKGNLIHAVLDRFLKAPPPGEPLPALIALGDSVFDEFKVSPALRLIWWPRFMRIASWFVDMQERRAQEGIRTLGTEREGRLEFAAPAGMFTLTGKIDRIDSRSEGLEIIDYKTGSVPSKGDVESGIRPQLPLGAALVESGGVQGIAGAVAQLTYWQISGGHTPGEEKIMQAPPEDILQRLKRRVALFDDPAIPYAARPPLAGARDYHAAYAHLARVKEWAGGEEGEG